MKQFILVFSLILSIFYSQAQRSLKITREKETFWNDDRYKPWPVAYTYYSDDEAPILSITRLDNGSNFQIGWAINGASNSFDVEFKRYNSEKDWYEYEDANGDQLCVLGSTLSSLSEIGWPHLTVQIYMWLDSEGKAFLLE